MDYDLQQMVIVTKSIHKILNISKDILILLLESKSPLSSATLAATKAP